MVSKENPKPLGRPKKSPLNTAAKNLSDANDAFQSVKSIVDEQLDLTELKDYELDEVQSHFKRRLELYLEIDKISAEKRDAKVRGNNAEIDEIEAKRVKTLSMLSKVPAIGYTCEDWEDMQELMDSSQRKPGKAKITIEQRYNRAKIELDAAQEAYRALEVKLGVKKPKSFDLVIDEEKASRAHSGGHARKLSKIDSLDKELLLAIRERDSVQEEISYQASSKSEPSVSVRGRKPIPLNVRLESAKASIAELTSAIAAQEANLSPMALLDTQIRRVQVAQRLIRKAVKNEGFNSIESLDRNSKLSQDFTYTVDALSKLKTLKLELEIDESNDSVIGELREVISHIKKGTEKRLVA
nr:hypothetical protein [Vibrio splendidus]MCC4882982.1 hypothetical protein [Vibrio splendidus]